MPDTPKFDFRERLVPPGLLPILFDLLTAAAVVFNGNPSLIDLQQRNLRAWRTGDGMANTATIRNANGLPATFRRIKDGAG
jgi:hypothetical protein